MPRTQSQEGQAQEAAKHGGFRTLHPIARDLQAELKWAFVREENAARTIQKLSYRLSCNSELAIKARTYASGLKHYVARLEALLPPGPRRADDAFTHEVLTDSVIQSLDSERASMVLIRFLFQHSETTSETLKFVGDRLKSKAIQRLWLKSEKERAKVTAWLETQEKLSLERLKLETPNEKDAVSTSLLIEESLIIEADDHVDDQAPSMKLGQREDTPRILYNPPQIVKWM